MDYNSTKITRLQVIDDHYPPDTQIIDIEKASQKGECDYMYCMLNVTRTKAT